MRTYSDIPHPSRSKAIKFFRRKSKIKKRLQILAQLEVEIADMRKAQKKLVADNPETAQYLDSEDFI